MRPTAERFAHVRSNVEVVRVTEGTCRPLLAVFDAYNCVEICTMLTAAYRKWNFKLSPDHPCPSHYAFKQQGHIC